jgi:hypothetical protein
MPALTTGGRLRASLAALGAVALLLLTASLRSGRAALLGWPVALLLVEEAAAVVAHHPAGLAGAAVPLYGAGLLLAAELASAAARRRGPDGAGPEPPEVAWRRLGGTGALALASVVLGSGLLLLAAAAPSAGPAGTWLRVAAVAAAVATIAVVVALAVSLAAGWPARPRPGQVASAGQHDPAQHGGGW